MLFVQRGSLLHESCEVKIIVIMEKSLPLADVRFYVLKFKRIQWEILLVRILMVIRKKLLLRSRPLNLHPSLLISPIHSSTS